MPVSPHAFVIGILCVLFLFLTTAQAQTAVSYRFLEVVDTAGKPVVDAKVETNMSAQQTDEKGTVMRVPVYYGDYTTRSLQVSKPGYFTYDGISDLFFSARDEHLLRGENPEYDPRVRIKIELLKVPVTPAEREELEVAHHKRELLLATKQGNATTVRRLLRAGIDANTTDVNGLPVILWAATSGNAETIKALLAASADVRSKDKPGRKVLLYYLFYTPRDAINLELVRDLLKAGADVNADDGSGNTALALAKRAGNAEVIKQIERAGAQHK